MHKLIGGGGGKRYFEERLPVLKSEARLGLQGERE
jgi:hypothetical protein